MKNKAKSEMKSYKATVSITFEAPSHEVAMQRAREAFEGKDVRIKLQEGVVAWMTVPEAPIS